MLWDFNTEEIAIENYENWKNIGECNLTIDKTKVAFNSTKDIGKTKAEIANGQYQGELEEY